MHLSVRGLRAHWNKNSWNCVCTNISIYYIILYGNKLTEWDLVSDQTCSWPVLEPGGAQENPPPSESLRRTPPQPVWRWNILDPRLWCWWVFRRSTRLRVTRQMPPMASCAKMERLGCKTEKSKLARKAMGGRISAQHLSSKIPLLLGHDVCKIWAIFWPPPPLCLIVTVTSSVNTF